jgi:hypothetical protein
MTKRFVRKVSSDNIPEELVNHLALISGRTTDEIRLEINQHQKEKLEIKKIINPFFDDLSSKGTKDSQKKISELIDLGKFIYSLDDKNEIEIVECGERPDFKIKYHGELVGIEHTGIFDDNIVAEIKTLKKIIKKSQEKLSKEQSHIKGLFNIIVAPSKINGQLNHNLESNVQNICDYVIARHKGDHFEKPNFIVDITYDSHPDLELTLGEDYTLTELTTELITKAILKKEEKIDSYKQATGLSRFWLLIVIEGASSASSFNISTENLPTHLVQFEMVFIFDNFKRDIRIGKRN